MKGLHLAFALGLLLVGSSLITVSSRTAQKGQLPEPVVTNCEDNIALLSTAHQAAGAELIIVIARLGDRERKRELNQRRLHNVRVYLTEFAWNRSPETVITAEGEQVKGLGRVEIYVRGKLFTTLGITHNGDLLVGSCEPDDIRPIEAERNLYPYRDRRTVQKRGKS